MQKKLEIMLAVALMLLSYVVYVALQYERAKEKEVVCHGKWADVTYLTQDSFEKKTATLCILDIKKQVK